MAARGTRHMRGGAVWQTVGLALLAVVTLVLCYLALTRDTESETTARDAAAAEGTPTASASPSGSESASPSSSPSAVPSDPPKVDLLRNADFTKGGDLPDGARLYDNPAVGSPMVLADGALTHGAPTGPAAVSSMETELKTPVQKLSARIQFADADSGSVALVAWQGSLITARQADQPVPASGLRLVVTPEGWELTVYDKKPVVIASGKAAAGADPVTYTVYRQDDAAWVEDPTGKVTTVRDPRISTYAGPWACWQLLEDTATQVPASILAVSAG